MATATVETPTTDTGTAGKQPQKYQIRYGTYWQGGNVTAEGLGPNRVLTANGKPIPYGPGRKAGDIVESDTDLTKLNDRNHPAGPRFVRLGDQTNPAEAELTSKLKAESDRANKYQSSTRNLLEKMSARDLIEYAEGEEIDLRGETSKAGVLRTILAAQGLT